MLDRLTGFQVFARVAALGSLSAAARALGMSQTMATKHMAALESRLGTTLVHRTTRRLTLTEPGRRYLEHVERLLAAVDEADNAAAADTIDVRGTLRLNAPVSFGTRRIAPLVAELCQRHPRLTVDLGLNDRYVDLIEEGWDMAVRIGTLTQASLVAKRLAPCATIVCAAPAYLEAHGTPRTIAGLGAHNCLGYTLSRDVGPDRWTFGRGSKVKVAVTGSFRANSGDALVAAAVAGLGIIYSPAFLVDRELADGRLRALALDHDPIAIDGIFAIYPAGRRPPAKVRTAIDFLAERLHSDRTA